MSQTAMKPTRFLFHPTFTERHARVKEFVYRSLLAAGLGDKVVQLLTQHMAEAVPYGEYAALLVDGHDNGAVLQSLLLKRHRTEVWAYHGGDAVQELPHVQGREWKTLEEVTPAARDARSMWSRFWRSSPVERFKQDAGDWMLPLLTETAQWRPLIWVNLRDAKKLPDHLLDNLVPRRVAKAWISSKDVPMGEKHPNLPARFRVLQLDTNPKLDEPEWTLSLRTVLERAPENKGVQMYGNAFPLKHVPRERLRWMVEDGEWGAFIRQKEHPRLEQWHEGHMRTADLYDAKGNLNELHLAIRRYLRETEGKACELVYGKSAVPERTFPPADVMAAFDGIYEEEFWRKKLFSPTGRWTDHPELVRLKPPGWHVFLDGRLARRDAVYFEVPADTFLNLGCNGWSMWDSQGMPLWLDTGRGRTTPRQRKLRSAGMEDEDPTPGDWALGWLDKGMRDQWTPFTREEETRDYVPPTPPQDAFTALHRMSPLLDRLEVLNRPRRKPFVDLSRQGVLEEAWDQEDREHRREMVKTEWALQLEPLSPCFWQWTPLMQEALDNKEQSDKLLQAEEEMRQRGKESPPNRPAAREADPLKKLCREERERREAKREMRWQKALLDLEADMKKQRRWRRDYAKRCRERVLPLPETSNAMRHEIGVACAQMVETEADVAEYQEEYEAMKAQKKGFMYFSCNRKKRAFEKLFA